MVVEELWLKVGYGGKGWWLMVGKAFTLKLGVNNAG